MNRIPQRPILVAMSVCIALGLSGPVKADLKNCAGISDNPSAYKIVLDDLKPSSGAAAADASVAALQERLEFNLAGQLETIRAAARKWADQLQIPLRSVVCVGRQPSFTGSEFTLPIASILSDHRVVVEMWGTLDSHGGAAGVTTPRARIGYLIPPVRRYSTTDAAPGFLVIAYPRTQRGAATAGLESLRELAAFALIGLGTKAAKAQSYDLAVWAFSRAEASISGGSTGECRPGTR